MLGLPCTVHASAACSMSMRCEGQYAASCVGPVCKWPASHRRAGRALLLIAASDMQDACLDSLQHADELVQNHDAQVADFHLCF